MLAEPEVGTPKSSKKIKSAISKLIDSLKKHIHVIYIVFRKTLFFDLYNPWKFIFAIIIVAFFPFYFLMILPEWYLDDPVVLSENLGLLYVIYSYMIMLPFILIYSAASLISEEKKSGTMLLLASKPITRGEIMWGKYIAVLFYCLIISTISLGVVCLTAFLKVNSFEMIPFFWTQFLLSLVIIFFFGTVTMGFSLVFRNVKISMVIPVLFVFFLIFMFIFIKPALMLLLPSGESYYEAYHFYFYDLGYYIMNIYAWFYESLIAPLSEVVTVFIAWGVYKAEYDPFIGDVYVKTNYLYPQISLVILIVFAVIIISIGFFIFKKRDIN